MTWNDRSPQQRLRIIAAVILLTGLGSAVLIWLTAGEPPESIPGYYPEDTKKYIHDLELYGGKTNLLASELMGWFGGLWQGRSLAYTVAFLAVAIAGGILFVARHAASQGHPHDRGDEGRD